MKSNNFKLSKTDKTIIYTVLFVPVLVLVGFIIRGIFFDPMSPRDYFLEVRKDYGFHGKIDSIYRQKANHDILTLKSQDNILPVEWEWQNKFKVGDSVSKQKGSLLVEHYRNGRLLEVLNYEDLRNE